VTARAHIGRTCAALALVAGAALLFAAEAAAHDDLAPAIERLASPPSPDAPETPVARAERLLARGELERLARRFDRAAADYDASEREDPSHGSLATLALCRAALAADQERWARAESLATDAAMRAPDDARAWRLRATCRRALGRPREALIDLDRALACPGLARPDDAIERARLALALDGPDEALAGLERALVRHPASTPLVLEAMTLEVRLGRTDEALVRVDALFAHCERCAELHARKGDVLAAAGRRLEAEAEWTEALAAIETLGPRARPAEAELATHLRKALKDRS
jgi:tetratricopeptide (TPR) repeat protein